MAEHATGRLSGIPRSSSVGANTTLLTINPTVVPNLNANQLWYRHRLPPYTVQCCVQDPKALCLMPMLGLGPQPSEGRMAARTLPVLPSRQSVVSGYDEGTLMSKLKRVNDDIQDEVHQLKGIIETQAEGLPAVGPQGRDRAVHKDHPIRSCL